MDRLQGINKSLTNVGPAERLLSIISGLALLYLGWRKRDMPLGIGTAAAGSSFLLRGASGFCPVNQTLNRNSACPNASGKNNKNLNLKKGGNLDLKKPLA